MRERCLCGILGTAFHFFFYLLLFVFFYIFFHHLIVLSFAECLRSVWDSSSLFIYFCNSSWFDSYSFGVHYTAATRRWLWIFFYSTKKTNPKPLYFGVTAQLSVSHFQNRVRFQRSVVRPDNVSAFMRLDQHIESSLEKHHSTLRIDEALSHCRTKDV